MWEPPAMFRAGIRIAELLSDGMRLVELLSVKHSTIPSSSSITLSLSIRFIVIMREKDGPLIPLLSYETLAYTKKYLVTIKNIALKESSFSLC